jgi:hypothetical protein
MTLSRRRIRIRVKPRRTNRARSERAAGNLRVGAKAGDLHSICKVVMESVYLDTPPMQGSPTGTIDRHRPRTICHLT